MCDNSQNLSCFPINLVKCLTVHLVEFIPWFRPLFCFLSTLPDLFMLKAKHLNLAASVFPPLAVFRLNVFVMLLCSLLDRYQAMCLFHLWFKTRLARLVLVYI